MALFVLVGDRREVLHVEAGEELDLDLAGAVALGEQVDPGEDGQEEGHDHGGEVGGEVALHAVASSLASGPRGFLGSFLLSPFFLGGSLSSSGSPRAGCGMFCPFPGFGATAVVVVARLGGTAGKSGGGAEEPEAASGKAFRVDPGARSPRL